MLWEDDLLGLERNVSHWILGAGICLSSCNCQYYRSLSSYWHADSNLNRQMTCDNSNFKPHDTFRIRKSAVWVENEQICVSMCRDDVYDGFDYSHSSISRAGCLRATYRIARLIKITSFSTWCSGTVMHDVRDAQVCTANMWCTIVHDARPFCKSISRALRQQNHRTVQYQCHGQKCATYRGVTVLNLNPSNTAWLKRAWMVQYTQHCWLWLC